MSQNKTPWFNGKTLPLVRELLFKLCKQRHGDIFCEICKGDVCGYRGTGHKYYVEHIDNDALNWDPDNLQLSSPKCNTKKYYSLALDIRARARTHAGGDKDPETYSKNRVKLIEAMRDNLSLETMAMYKNVYGKPKFFEYVREQMCKKLRLPWKQILADGALITGTVRRTCEDWLEEITDSSFGDFKKVKDGDDWFLEWRDVKKPFTEIINKHVKP